MKHSGMLLLIVVVCPGCVGASAGGGGGGQVNDVGIGEDAANSSDSGDATTGDAGTDAAADTTVGANDATVPADTSPPKTKGSAGCGKAAAHKAGGVQVALDAGMSGDGMRGFFLSLPDNYDPTRPHRLIIGYAGTNWKGKQIRGYLKLEDGAANEIFVYPDPLWRTFDGWGKLGGWVLGPHAKPANGDGDLVFTEKLIEYMAANYCIDTERVFATGHSWGGDMAMVAACFLGDRIRAAVPVAANRPYWFEKGAKEWITCVGDAAMWIYFGLGDDHFTNQKFPGEFGDETRDFWRKERACDAGATPTDLELGAAGECVAYGGCSAPLRYCLYGKPAKHQVPNYYSEATKKWFRSM